jgi:hypothetical protein
LFAEKQNVYNILEIQMEEKNNILKGENEKEEERR